jgi:hypothetical protein
MIDWPITHVMPLYAYAAISAAAIARPAAARAYDMLII